MVSKIEKLFLTKGDNLWTAYSTVVLNVCSKALQKAEYYGFCIFAKFKTLFTLYIQNISRQNCFKYFAKYLCRLEFWLQNLITSLVRRALVCVYIITSVPYYRFWRPKSKYPRHLHQHFTRVFLYESAFVLLPKPNFNERKGAKKTFVQKRRT